MNLNPGEKIVHKAKIHRFCYVIPLLALGAGLLLTFPPEFQAQPDSRLYAAKQEIEHISDTLKNFMPARLWPYLVTFQAFRMNYAGLLLLIFGAIRLISAFSQRNFSRYWITNKRVLSQPSIFYKKPQEIPLDRLQNVRIHYGLIGKWINRGMVIIHDNGMREIELRHLSKPEKYRQAVVEAVRQYRGRSA